MAIMNSSEQNHAQDLRSSIWTVSSGDLAKFFLVYTLIYVGGSGYLMWIHLARDAPVHNIVSGIITGVSLIGIGVAPSLALVLIETWRFALIFSRGMAIRLEQKEARIRAREAELAQKFLEEGREEGREAARRELEHAVKAAYEEGLRDGMAKTRTNGSGKVGDSIPEEAD